MAIPTGHTLFKKKEGILTLTADQQTVTWTPNAGGPPTVSLPVANITNLQQTPDSSPKVMLKIFEKAAAAGDPVTYLFHFNTPEAKAEAQSIKDLLSRLLADLRTGDPSIPRPSAPSSTAPGTPAAGSGSAAGQNGQQPADGGDGGGSASGSMAFASAVNAQTQPATRWFDDVQLRNDIELQQSLMRKDESLHQTYMEALATKPSSISGAAFNSQFWSTRLGLLRAHAIEAGQRRGAYNVLSVVRPRTIDGELKVSISVEQVHMIFAQHPLVRRIYNENVPRRLSEVDFWSRFLQSRLCRALRGERVTDADHRDAVFDRYDAADNTQGVQSKIMAQSVVPHIIDIEGNEENQGGVKSGNAKDVEMRPRANIPIVRTLNSLSGKIMANVAPSDAIITGSADANDQHYAYDQLALRDLRGPEKEHKIMLNVKEQGRFFSNRRDAAPSSNARLFAKQNPSDVLFDVQGDLETLEDDGAGGIELHAGIGYNEDSEDDSDGDTSSKKRTHVGSRSVIRAAEREILSGVAQQRSQKFSDPASSTADSPMGLPPVLAAKCSLTHATTVEFLHQFWAAFLSGDPDRATELQYLAESLVKSRERIEAVAVEAETEREETVRRRKAEIRAHWEKTGKKIRWKADQVGGGRDAVLTLMRPTLDAVRQAKEDYDRALAAEGIKVSTEG